MHQNYLHTAKAPGTHPWAHHILPGSFIVAFEIQLLNDFFRERSSRHINADSLISDSSRQEEPTPNVSAGWQI